ncbi:MAG: hypothetical protein E4G95_08700, partial [Bacteroidia bacterium]
MSSMKHISRLFQIVLATGILYSCTTGNRLNPDITTEELSEHINYLASEELQGRLPGTPGDLAAAEYIRDKLSSYGLKPLEGNGFQEFELVSNVVAGTDNSFEIIGKQFEAGKDFSPFSFSENGSLDAAIVFAGYGFDINDDSIKWNDYDGVDVKGNWVLILRADPEVENSMSKFASYSNDRDKCMIARDKGAAGVLLVSGVEFDPKDEFEPLARGEFSVGLPVFRVTRMVAD